MDGPPIHKDDVVAHFLANACPDHHVRGGYAHVVARGTAERILNKHPEIARDSIHTAVVCGDLAEVERILRSRPESAKEQGGAKGSAGVKGATFILEDWEAQHPLWEPLLYLAFTRVDHPPSNDNAVAIARLLLDHGADPNAHFMAGDSRYTPLTGVIGEGEEERAPHARRNELARLLLERGAEPYDTQVVYNIHFRGEVLWYLELMHAESVKRGRGTDWDDPAWSMLNMGGYGTGARWHLEIALRHDDLELAEWCLAHGASPNAAPARDDRFPRGTLQEEALKRGQVALAKLLERSGATPADPRTFSTLERFTAACLRLDRQETAALARKHPDLLQSATAIGRAAERNRTDVVTLLFDLGVSPDVPAPEEGGQRPLHAAAYSGSVDVARLLLDRGAEVDPRESRYGATPLGFAVWGQRQGVIDLLGPMSRDLWNLAFTGHVDRLRELLKSEPALATSVHPDGETPMMRLPDDEAKAVEIVRLFLDHGAERGVRNEQGHTAADLAEKRGLEDVVRLL